AALAMESWPTRSRGFMSGILQGSWGLGFALSSLAYGLLYDAIGWRGLLWIGILPALVVVYVRYFVKEPEVWVENNRLQKDKKADVRAPLISIFKRGLIWNTINGCLWMASAFCVYYSIWALFSTYLQKDLNWTPVMVAAPLFWANIVVFGGNAIWGVVADKWGRKPAIILPALIGIFVTPLYLWTRDPTWIFWGFVLQGIFGGAIYGQNPSYLSERFPTEVRATASGFCYHQGAIWAGFTGPVLTYFAAGQPLGFTIPMLIATTGAAVAFVVTLLFSPETKGKELVPELTLVTSPAVTLPA